jgi:ribosome assembly protein RRB1
MMKTQTKIVGEIETDMI